MRKDMELITEIDGDKIRVLALSRSGCWLPLFELEITEEIFDVYRVPLFIKLESFRDPTLGVSRAQKEAYEKSRR